VVPGPEIHAFAAAALARTSLAAASRHLDEQCDQHLITEPAPGRYVLHDQLREPARTLAEREPRASRDAVRRLLGYYLHTAPAAARYITSARPDHHRLGRRQPRRPG
jgi:hypothetical protein